MTEDDRGKIHFNADEIQPLPKPHMTVLSSDAVKREKFRFTVRIHEAVEGGRQGHKRGKQIGTSIPPFTRRYAPAPAEKIIWVQPQSGPLVVRNEETLLQQLEFRCFDRYGNVSAPASTDKHGWKIELRPGPLKCPVPFVEVSASGRATLAGLRVETEELVPLDGLELEQTVVLTSSKKYKYFPDFSPESTCTLIVHVKPSAVPKAVKAR